MTIAGCAGVAAEDFGLVLELVLLGCRLGPRMTAAWARVLLDLGERQRPRSVLVEPEGIARGDDPPQEDGTRDAPGAGRLYFAAMRESRIPEVFNEKGMPVASVLTS